MKEYIISYDFGTGGIKSALYRTDGSSPGASFEAYPTHYPRAGWHEQEPLDWWNAIRQSTARLLAETKVGADNIEALSISGHSLGVVPLDAEGNLLRSRVPIWSDIRAAKEAEEFFSRYDQNAWYMETGNGFTPAMYAAFKLMWYRENEPEIFDKIHRALGTKDYINYLLTGEMRTDHSYASGCGFYDLKNAAYDYALLKAMGLPGEIFPEIVPSTGLIGTLTPRASEETGLPRDVKVYCGGVDNSCMALGARGILDGRVYTSLGSSAWIAVNSHTPVLDVEKRPYVFAHIIPGMYTSATSIFSAGSSLQWVRNELCKDILAGSGNAYDKMNELAASSPVGANKLLFNPSLAGGSGPDKTPNVRGAFIGLSLKHTQADVIRAAMEGIAMALRVALDHLRQMTALQDEMLFVGGGANSPLWMQIFADVYGMDVLRTNVGQDAGSLGAAAIAAVGCGMWDDFSPIDEIHRLRGKSVPQETNRRAYERLTILYKTVTQRLWEMGDLMHGIEL